MADEHGSPADPHIFEAGVCEVCGDRCKHPNLEHEWVLGVGRTRYCPDCGTGW